MIVEYLVDNLDDLRIADILIDSSIFYSIEDIPSLDITILSLKQKAWEIIKGKRDKREYLNPENDLVVCQTRYEYVIDDSNKVTDFDIIFEWLDLNGDVGLRKTIDKELSRKFLTRVNREIRHNQIDWLMSEGDNLRNEAENVPEPYKSSYIQFADALDALFVRYQTLTYEYIERGTNSLYNAVLNEQEEPYSSTLDIIDEDSGSTMRSIFLNEIS